MKPDDGPGREPLIGRDVESAWLAGALGAASAGEPAVRLLAGRAGIGKSALLDELCGTVPGSAGVRVLRARGRERTAGISFSVVRDLFGPLGLGSGTADPELLEGRARWSASALDDGPTGAEPDNIHPVLHGLYWLTVNLTARSPLLLVVDDLQWCDDASLAFLGFLVRRLAGLRVAVVLATRTDDAGALPARLAEIAGQVGDDVAEVRPLDRAGVGRLVAVRLPAGGPVPVLLDALVDVSGGSPLLVERLVAELGPLSAEQAAVRVRELGREVIDNLVSRHVGAGPPHVEAVAAAVAVVGAEDADVIASLAEVPAVSVRDAVEALARADVFGPDRPDFRHDLLRAAVLRRLPADRLDDLRRRGARVLSDAGRPAEVVAAVLLALPGTAEPWMTDVLLEAAAAAGHRGAHPTAARYLEPVLAARPRDVAVRLQLAGALGQTAPGESLTHLRRALELAPDLPTRARVAVALGMTSLAVQQAPQAADVLQDVLDALDETASSRPGPELAALRTHVEAALLVVGLDEKKTVAATIARMGRMSVPEGHTPAERQKLAMMTVTRAMKGDGADAARDQARRVLLVDEATLGGWAVLASSLVLRLADEVEESSAVLGRLVTLSREQASSWTYSLAIGTRSANHLVAGDLAEAESDARSALDVAEQEAWRGNTVVPTIALANVRFLQGRPEDALGLLDGLSRPRLEDFAWEYHDYLMARAGASADAGDVEGALALYRRCGDSLAAAGITNPVLAPWWARAAVLLADTGRARSAAAVVERGEQDANRWGTARARGLALIARGVISPGPRGTELLREAVTVLRDSPARLELILAHHRLGRAVLEDGDPEAARDHLRHAATLAARCGALRAATSARELLVRAGGRMRRPTGSPLDPLTGAERRVVALVADGARNREVAEALFVTLRTVEVHLTSAFRKLGVNDRTGLSEIVSGARVRQG